MFAQPDRAAVCGTEQLQTGHVDLPRILKGDRYIVRIEQRLDENGPYVRRIRQRQIPAQGYDTGIA
jgi:hypothetical protein